MGRRDTNGTQDREVRIRFLDVLRVRAFAVLWATEAQSIVGDQLARVALSVLVFDRTSSATATALTYAATYLPAILGGALLGGLGDRFSRRLVMIGCNLVRAVLFGAMALPGAPLPLIVALLIGAVFVEPVFGASEVSYLSAVLSPEQFRVATGTRMITSQTAQVGGFALGGVLVALMGARGALMVDAATFLLSAVVIAVALRPESARPESARPESTRPESAGGADPAPATGDDPEFHGLWRDRRLRGLILLAMLAGFFVVPEGLAVPFGRGVGASTAETGLLLASIPLGGALGAVALVRYVRPRHRFALARTMAVACGLPLVATAFVPHWPIVVACWLVSGGLAAYQIEIITSVVQAIPDALAARLVGIFSALLLGAQGMGLVIFGLVAHQLSPGSTVALAGVAGSALAAVVVVALLRRRPRHRAARRARPSGRGGTSAGEPPSGRSPDVALNHTPDARTS